MNGRPSGMHHILIEGCVHSLFYTKSGSWLPVSGSNLGDLVKVTVRRRQEQCFICEA